jgi:hypothetical protein
MSNLLPITAVIITKNEELHIRRLLRNINGIFNEIVILDSFSEDRTGDIALEYNVKFIKNKFKNFGDQRNVAMKSSEVTNKWVFFIDADEIVDDDLITELRLIFTGKITHDGFYINRKFIFMNKWIKYGGYYPIYLLRLVNKEKTNCTGIINEHLQIDGKTTKIKNGHLIDHNLNNFQYWVNKHNNYSDLESIEFFTKSITFNTSPISSQAGFKNYIKIKIYNNIPLFFRPFAYFFYRFFLKLGFLDGYKGFIYHTCQGFIFWFFVDVKIYEKKIKKNE